MEHFRSFEIYQAHLEFCVVSPLVVFMYSLYQPFETSLDLPSDRPTRILLVTLSASDGGGLGAFCESKISDFEAFQTCLVT